MRALVRPVRELFANVTCIYIADGTPLLPPEFWKSNTVGLPNGQSPVKKSSRKPDKKGVLGELAGWFCNRYVVGCRQFGNVTLLPAAPQLPAPHTVVGGEHEPLLLLLLLLVLAYSGPRTIVY
jgi:hypothetical protein